MSEDECVKHGWLNPIVFILNCSVLVIKAFFVVHYPTQVEGFVEILLGKKGLKKWKINSSKCHCFSNSNVMSLLQCKKKRKKCWQEKKYCTLKNFTESKEGTFKFVPVTVISKLVLNSVVKM